MNIRKREAPVAAAPTIQRESDALLASITKVHGPNVMRRAIVAGHWKHIPLGVFALDMAMFGGLPRSAISMFYGWEACLASNTPLKYIVVDPATGVVQNCKGGTIEKLYHRFHGKTMPGKGHYQRLQTESSKFYVMGVNEDGCIVRNEIADVVKTGVKSCFEMKTAKGFSIASTADHKFFTGTQYVKLSDLKVGDTVFVHDNTTNKWRNATAALYPETHIKWYYRGKSRDINGSTYFRQRTHRLVYEASLNGLTLAEYRTMLDSGITALPRDWVTIPEGMHVHHRDENRLNYDIENLELIDPVAHGHMHATDKHNNLRFVATEDRIVSIEAVGEAETYDIKCYHPYNNYVAAGFVTHNSGKTTMGLRALASAQKMFPDQRAAIIDAEGTYDPKWGKAHGIDNENLLLVQPETGEQALDIANGLLRSADISIVMVDSLPALVPAKEQEKSLEDDIVAMQARLIGRFIRVANCAILDERKRDHLPALLLINQWRSKIAYMGDTRSLPGGNALKFFVFNRVELMNKEILGKDQFDVETVLHNEHSFKVTKNKEGTGIRNGAFTMIRDPGNPLGSGFIDDAETVLAFAKKFGIYTGAGKHQKFDNNEIIFGTMKEAAEHFYSDLDFFEATKLRLIGMQRDHSGLDTEHWL